MRGQHQPTIKRQVRLWPFAHSERATLTCYQHILNSWRQQSQVNRIKSEIGSSKHAPQPAGGGDFNRFLGLSHDICDICRTLGLEITVCDADSKSFKFKRAHHLQRTDTQRTKRGRCSAPQPCSGGVRLVLSKTRSTVITCSRIPNVKTNVPHGHAHKCARVSSNTREETPATQPCAQ